MDGAGEGKTGERVTSSLQDYLETILELSKKEYTVRVTDIALSLNIAKPSVAQALQILKERGFINQSRYGPVELTAKGIEFASIIRYRHRVLRFFLQEVLKVSPQAAEEDACLMEHDLSDETFEKLLKYLENRKEGPSFNRDSFQN